MGEHLPRETQSSHEAPLFSLITCTKCHRLMDSPRELDCGHIFCQDCLPVVNRTWDKQSLLLRQFSVVCLECGKFTQIQGKEVNKLPQASWVQLLKNFLGTSTSKNDTDKSCSGCKSQNSEKWCQDCCILLCRSCANSHVLLRRMKEHTVKDKSNAFLESRNMLCPTHRDPMKWLCEDCPRLLCFQCIHQQQCSDHNYENIATLVEQRATKIKDISEHIESECDKLEEFRKALSLYEEDKTSLFEENEDKITENIDKSIESLQKAKTEMLKLIETKRKMFVENLEELRAGVSDKLKDYEKVKEVVQSVSLPPNQMELVLACPLLEKRVNTNEPSQYRLREQVEDFNLIFKEGKLDVPELLVKYNPLSPRRSPRQRGGNTTGKVTMTPCSVYGANWEALTTLTSKNVRSASPVSPPTKVPQKTALKRLNKPPAEFYLHVPPPLPERRGFDEVDSADSLETSAAASTLKVPNSSDSGIDSTSPESMLNLSLVSLEETDPVCNSVIETNSDSPEKKDTTDKKWIDPTLMTAALPSLPKNPVPPVAPKPLQQENSIFYINNCRTKGYAVVNTSSCMHPLPPSDKQLTWDVIKITDGFEVLVLPNGNVLVSCENGVKLYDPDANFLKSQTILGAKGMAYRPGKRDILVAGYHSNSIFALHDSSLTFKADLKVTLKKSERPWGCAALSNGGFVVLYSKDDKYLFLDFYDDEDNFVKSTECGLSAKGPLHMTTDCKDLIFISDESHNQIVICYPNDNYIQTVIVDSPRGMVCSPHERGFFFASSTSICQLKLSQRNGRFSDYTVTDLGVDVQSVGIFKEQFICLTPEEVKVVPKELYDNTL